MKRAVVSTASFIALTILLYSVLRILSQRWAVIESFLNSSKSLQLPPYAHIPMRNGRFQTYFRRILNPTHSKITPMTLICEEKPVNSESEAKANNHIYDDGIYATMIKHNFSLRCPEVYDYLGNRHQAPHMCVTSMQPSFCEFRLKDVVLTVWGGVMDKSSHASYQFDHPSIGMLPPIYYTSLHLKWQSYFPEAIHRTPLYSSSGNGYQSYDIVVPTRMRWDDHFNHLSHQSLPLIAYVYEFYPDLFNKVYWHCSVFTAALLYLIDDIPHDRVLVQSIYQQRDKQPPIIASQLLLPWIPGWSPPQTSTIFGIGKRLSKQITTKLLSKYSDDQSMQKLSDKRTVLYLSRHSTMSRGVTNEAELISILQHHLNHELYDFVIVNSTTEQKSVEDLWKSWYPFARYFSKAKAVIGPHGSAFNNIMWSPNDIDIIEFNLFPDDTEFTSSDSECYVRPTLIAAAWCKGITGKYFNIDPSKKNKKNFYEQKIRVSPYEFIETLKLLSDNILSPDSKVWDQKWVNTTYPYESHIYW